MVIFRVTAIHKLKKKKNSQVNCTARKKEYSEPIFFFFSLHLKTSDGYGKCPKISNSNVSDKMAYANSADPEEQSDQGLYCLPFH